ncbi:Major DNA-binding protein [Cacatuid alphaherpesvirus 2]|uniref:Major DNA-binding protein n=1 Tax=Cacatuid alphaherpesvirus 2 TaxID=2604840 RepID=A0A5B9R4M2_9ALPH|nr:Major DNA-binding protein [Cacatuid alphaherpesvirus 2]QEG54040.1 Major DNA-binding protein [Cacatuid alphaherpesvirus 2]
MDSVNADVPRSGKTETIQYEVGPVAYIYARSKLTIDSEEWGLLCAKSRDQPSSAVAPLIPGLTVEEDFTTSIAAVIGTKSSGLVGGTASAILSPCHFSPCVYIFYGGDCINPTSLAPGLTILCDEARTKFGFTSPPSTGPVANARETSGESICMQIGLEPETTMLYLVATEPFCEAIYMCNTFLHFGGADSVYINSETVRRIPVYPVQMYMPDIALRLCRNPFDSNSRNIGEGCAYPKALYNKELNRVLHGAVLAPQGMSLRTRDLEAIAKAATTVAFDGNFEGCVLAAEKTFTQSSAATKTQTRSPNDIERRAACSLVADLALTTRVSVSCAPYRFEGGSEIKYNQWPLFANAKTQQERTDALSKFMAELAGIIAAGIFSTNSPLYASEVVDGGQSDSGDKQANFSRFFFNCGLSSLGSSIVDYAGNVIPGTENNPTQNHQAFEYGPEHLAYACGFSPELTSRALFFLERCSRYQLGADNRCSGNPLKFAAVDTSMVADCRWCSEETRQYCVRHTLHRLKTRLPAPRAARRGPMAVFGAVDADYTDCDQLGNFAPYSDIKRSGDGDSARNIMNDTYVGLCRRVAQFLIADGLVCGDTGEDARNVQSAKDLRATFELIESMVDRECAKFVSVLGGTRGYNYEARLPASEHTFVVTLNPYSTAFCPMLSHLVSQTKAIILQDIMLSQVPATFDKGQVETKMFRSAAMPTLRSDFMSMLDKGFLSGKQSPVVVSASSVTAPDTSVPSTEKSAVQYEYSLTRGQVLRLREFRIKNKFVYKGGDEKRGSMARMQGMTENFSRPLRIKNINILGGPLGFLLKRSHNVIFGSGMDVFEFWHKVIGGYMPKSQLTEENIETLKFIRRVSKTYAEGNYIKSQPQTFLELANFMVTNKILAYCGYEQSFGKFYVSTPSMIVMDSAKNKDPCAELVWLPPVINPTTKNLIAAAEKSIADNSSKWISASKVTNSCRLVMNYKPVVALGLMISKYCRQQSPTTVFQAGNWSSLIGSCGVQSVNACLSGDIVKKYALACKRVDSIIKGAASKYSETSLSSKIKAMVESGCTPKVIYIAILRALGDGLRDVTTETWLAMVDDQFMVEALEAIHANISENTAGGWSQEAAMIKLNKDGQTMPFGEEEEMLNFADGEDDADINNQDETTRHRFEDDDTFAGPSAKKRALATDVLFC